MRLSEWRKGSQGHDQTSRSQSDLKEEGRRLNRNQVVNGCLSTVEPYREGEPSLRSLERSFIQWLMRKTDVGKESQWDREAVGGQRSLFRDPPSGFLPEETPEENLSSKFSQTVEQSDILNFYGDRQFSQHVIRFNVVCIIASMQEPDTGQGHKSGTLSAHSTCSFLTLCVKESHRDQWCDWGCRSVL